MVFRSFACARHGRAKNARSFYARINAAANASYGPAFRQTRQHCRRPIIRAAANSTSVHDAAQSWRTTANWDCSVIRVNTMGKKHYSEERSANVRSNMCALSRLLPTLDNFQPSRRIHRYDKSHQLPSVIRSV